MDLLRIILTLLIIFSFYHYFLKFKKVKSSNRDEYHPLLKQKVVLITGCNSGIGLSTLTLLVQKAITEIDNAQQEKPLFIMLVRSEKKAKDTVQMIATELKKSVEEIEQFCQFISPIDFCDIDSVLSFIHEFEKKNYKIDVLINNAGVLFLHGSLISRDTPTTFSIKDKTHSITWYANYLGHAVLTHLLYEKKSFSKNAKIINVSSSLHYLCTLYGLNRNDIEGLNSPHLISYAKTKLAQILWTRRLQKFFEEKSEDISVLSIHPGYPPTNITSYLPSPIRKLQALLFPILESIFPQGFTTDVSATAIVNLVTLIIEKRHKGNYWKVLEMENPSFICENQDQIDQLWNYTLNFIQQVKE